MSTFNRGQENRYLESPYVIKGTVSGGQMPFASDHPIGSGLIFSQDDFFAMPDKTAYEKKVHKQEEDESIKELAVPSSDSE